MQSACTLKGGCLSIATHGPLLALQPSPPGLDPRHRDLSYQRQLNSLEGRDLRTYSIKESAGKREEAHEDLTQQHLSCRHAGPTLRQKPLQTYKISHAKLNRLSAKLSPSAALSRQCCLPFLPSGGCLSAKGDLLIIATQGLLLDLGPLTSWP